jgi:hypothetical protein
MSKTDDIMALHKQACDNAGSAQSAAERGMKDTAAAFFQSEADATAALRAAVEALEKENAELRAEWEWMNKREAEMRGLLREARVYVNLADVRRAVNEGLLDRIDAALNHEDRTRKV